MRQKLIPLAIFSFGVLAIVADQVLKAASNSHVFNSGFGLGLNLGDASWLIQVVVLAGLLIVVSRLQDKVLQYGLILAALISVSNLYDRLTLGYVIDYWQIAGIWVNLSDVLISSVMAIMLLNYLHIFHVFTKFRSGHRPTSA